jgi:WD40 repeat protein
LCVFVRRFEGDGDNQLCIWGLHNGTAHGVLEHVRQSAWSPHQHGLLAVEAVLRDRCIRFWNTATNQSCRASTRSSGCDSVFLDLQERHLRVQGDFRLGEHPNTCLDRWGVLGWSNICWSSHVSCVGSVMLQVNGSDVSCFAALLCSLPRGSYTALAYLT